MGGHHQQEGIMKYHIRVFKLDLTNKNTAGQYLSPPVQQSGGEPEGWGEMTVGGELKGSACITLDRHLEAEAQEGYHLERMVSLPGHLAHMLRVVTVLQ